MKVDFITPTVLFTQSKELKAPLTKEESQDIFDKFSSLHQYIPLSIEGFKFCAKDLSSVSNKKIKINHALEIFSREFFNLPWHTLLAQFKKNESIERLDDIFYLLEELQSSPAGLNSFIFTPYLTEEEYKKITNKYPQAQLIKDKDVFIEKLNIILDDTQKRLEEGNKEKVDLLIACPFYVNQLHNLKNIDRSCFSRLISLAARSRTLGIRMYFPNQGISYCPSERTPAQYKVPNFSSLQKKIFKINKN